MGARVAAFVDDGYGEIKRVCRLGIVALDQALEVDGRCQVCRACANKEDIKFERFTFLFHAGQAGFSKKNSAQDQ